MSAAADVASSRPQLAVGAVAVDRGELLLVRRAQAPEAGRWSLPGGRVESGETLAQAVEREVREETGLVARCGDFLGWVERIGAEHHFVILDFAVTVAGARVLWPGGDAAEAAWVALEAVPGVALVEGLEAFLRRHRVL